MLTITTNEVMSAILSCIDEAIHAVNQDGVTIFYNEVAAKHDGVRVQDVLGKHVLDAFPSLTKDTSTLLRVLQMKRAIVQQPQTYQNMKGTRIHTINTTLPIIIADHVVGAVEIAKDYSTIKTLSEKVWELQEKVQSLSQRRRRPTVDKCFFREIATNDDKIMQVKRQAERVAQTDSCVLIYGETGTGKELFVQAIHHASKQKQGPFIAQNCAALPESLLESLLLGTTKGSYTGATDRPGLFELAHNGTLFLDEMNSMPLNLQAKLLRILEDGVVRRIGDAKTRRVHVRVIVALNECPLTCVENGILRPDLYYRLNVFSLHVPSLRERRSDIKLLIRLFIEEFNVQFMKHVYHVHDDLYDLFCAYDWPGNIRELKHTVEHAMIMADGDCLTIKHLPLHFQTLKNRSATERIRPLRQVLQDTERELICSALQATNQNVKQAAALLGIPRQTLQYKIQKQEISL